MGEKDEEKGWKRVKVVGPEKGEGVGEGYLNVVGKEDGEGEEGVWIWCIA